jgi:galactokinase
MSTDRSAAFAPGRVNLIGEHTDYNDGLALPFAIGEGVTVKARALHSRPQEPVAFHSRPQELVYAQASDFGEHDEFPLADPQPAEGWRAFVRGTVAELQRAGYPLVGAKLELGGNVPRGLGLSSSAALEVALCLALVELGAGERVQQGGAWLPRSRVELARLCARVEHVWVGAKTGLLDQLACLYGIQGAALCIDFRSLDVSPVPLQLGDWRLVVLDSGQRHTHSSSGYNARRKECAMACELLGVTSLRDVDADALRSLPSPLDRRARHVVDENERVPAAVAALRAGDLAALGALLNAAHASLRDRYEVSTPAVERAVRALREAGAAGARIVGGGFGGGVLGLFAPGVEPPVEAHEVRPGAGAHLLPA